MIKQFHIPKKAMTPKKLSPKQRRAIAMKRHKPVSLTLSSGQEPYITAFFLLLGVVLMIAAYAFGGGK